MPNTGLKYATSVSNNAGAGSTAWSNPSNAVGNNTNTATYAGVTASTLTFTTQYLQFNFTHGLSGGNTFNGITIAFYRAGSDQDQLGVLPTDLTIKLVKDGTIVGTNKSAGATWADTTFAWTADFGSSSDMWGTSMTSANTLGVVLQATINSTNNTVDWARVCAARATVYYTSSSSVSSRRSMSSRTGSRCCQ